MKRIVVTSFLLLASAPALAEPLDTSAVRDQQRDVARVTARTHFVRGDVAGCPSAAARCSQKAYLLAGDPVILGKTRAAYREVSFTDARGRITENFMPASALAPWTVPPVWTGHWVRDEATIDIEPGKRPGTYAVTGDATWGTHDPERIERDGVNMGELAGEAKPVGGLLRGGDEKAEYDCAWSLKLAGPYLIAADNGMCGGMNVRFTGFYRRAGAAPKKR